MSWVFIILFVVLGLALVFVFKNRDRDEEKAKLGITGILAAIVVLIIIQVIVGGREPDPLAGYDPAIDEGIGETIAREIAGEMQGRRLVIISEMGNFRRIAQARLQGAVRGFEAADREVIDTVDSVSVQQDGELIISEEGMARGLIEKILTDYPDLDTIVSLAGFPPMSDAEMAAAFRNIEFFVVDEHPWLEWVPLVSRGVIDGIVMSPRDADWSNDEGSPEELFHRRYMLVTRGNLEGALSRVNYESY